MQTEETNTEVRLYPHVADKGTLLPVRKERVRRVTNQQFAKMTPAQQRVTIARDVLLWLDGGKLLPSPGSYLVVFNEGVLLTDAAEVNGYQCNACALGAVFACAVDRRPGFDLQSVGFWPDGARRLLGPYFDEVQLAAIECAFEMSGLFFPDRLNAEDMRQRAKDFGMAIHHAVPVPEDGWREPVAAAYHAESARRRMRAIMQNIIDNDGTFVP